MFDNRSEFRGSGFKGYTCWKLLTINGPNHGEEYLKTEDKKKAEPLLALPL
jgi:hypothetical protein